MKKIILFISSTLLMSLILNGQEGKPSVKVFTNFNYDISAKENENAFKEFEIKTYFKEGVSSSVHQQVYICLHPS